MKRYSKKILFGICLLILINLSFANNKVISDTSRYTKSLQLNYEIGSFIPTHSFIKGENPMNEPYTLFQSFSVQYGIHTDGRKHWQQIYAYPVWGVSLFYVHFFDDTELGYPVAVYPYIKAPFKRWEKWSINYEVGLGLSFNWKAHELLENGYYYPIGSYANVFFDFGINADIILTKKWNLIVAMNYSHYSNGAVKLPNLGINLCGARIGAQYMFRERPNYIVKEIPDFENEWEWLITASPSIRQVGFEYHADGDTLVKAFDYGIFTISTAVNRQLSHKVKFGGGFDFSYNGAYAAQSTLEDGEIKKIRSNAIDQILIGAYPSFELVFNKLSMLVQPGFYIYRKKYENIETSSTYQRIGLRYYVGKHFIAGLNIRAYDFSKADFIELNFGYSLRWKKSYRE
jgi:hypothetical protein